MRSNQKHRVTHQRQVILEEVRKLNTHPTADEVYERVRKKLPRISLGTVYRNLDILSRTGIIKKIDPGYPQMRFDGNTHDHYHITCMNCGRIEDLPVENPEGSLDDLEKKLLRLTEYSIFGHNLEFVGLCPRCMKEGESSLGKKMKEFEH